MSRIDVGGFGMTRDESYRLMELKKEEEKYKARADMKKHRETVAAAKNKQKRKPRPNTPEVIENRARTAAWIADNKERYVNGRKESAKAKQEEARQRMAAAIAQAEKTEANTLDLL
jgi:hypothetical protein